MSWRTQKLWHDILKYDSPNEMPAASLMTLKGIAKRMVDSDFTHGSASALGNKLLFALGYKSWKQLREISSFRKAVDFICLCRFLALVGHNDSLNQLFESDASINYGNKSITTEMLRKKYYEAMDLLGVAKKGKRGGVDSEIFDGVLGGDGVFQIYLEYFDITHLNQAMEAFRRARANKE